MICDWDDFSETNHRLDLLTTLKMINPLFRCTLFAIPGQCTPAFLETLPPWMELAVHGWMHPDAYECSEWSYGRTYEVLNNPLVQQYFVKGWKCPGWQINPDVYQAVLDCGYWIADQHLEDHRRPDGLHTYFYEDGPERWHGHIQDVCGNGLEETWGEISQRVAEATHFEWCSERLVVWRSPALAS